MKNGKLPLYAALCLSSIGGLFVFAPLLRLLGRAPTHAHIHIGHSGIHIPGAVVLPIIGIALIYLATFVYHRRLLAAYVSATIGVLIVIYLWIMHPFGFVALLITILMTTYVALVIVGRQQFIVKNNLENLSHHLRPIVVIALFGFIYGVLGFYVLGKPFFHAQFSLLTSIDMAIDALTGFSGTIDEPTRAGKLFIDSLGGIGIIVFALLLKALFRPLRLKVLPYQEDSDRRAAASLIRSSSRSSEDFFKLWPEDKHFFFSQTRQAFLAYKPSGRTVVVLGDPVGDPHSFKKLIAEFVVHCQSLGWLIAVVNATEASKQLFESQGLGSFFIGNEGIVDIAHFTSETSHDKHFRYVRNKAGRDNLTIDEWRHLSDKQMTELRTISNDWLSRGGRREYTFFMGYFDETYLRQSRIFVLSQNGQAVAYISLIPSFYKGHASIDHFRSGSNMSSVGMHFLLMSILEQLHGEHIKTLNIGLSPLSGMEEIEGKLLPKATLKLVRRFGSSYYSFQGLEQFKNKFRPVWEPRALLYTGASVNLVRVTSDVERAATYALDTDRQLYASTIAGVIILAIGIYFILG